MAERRMFAKSVVHSARCLKLPPSARLLYYDLGVQADDDGVAEGFSVARLTGGRTEDLRVLEAAGFLRRLNDDDVVLLTDWRQNNLVRRDRYTPSVYAALLRDRGEWTGDGTEETGEDRRGRRGEEADGAGGTNVRRPDSGTDDGGGTGGTNGRPPDRRTEDGDGTGGTNGQPPVDHRSTQDRTGKDREGQVREGQERAGQDKAGQARESRERESQSDRPGPLSPRDTAARFEEAGISLTPGAKEELAGFEAELGQALCLRAAGEAAEAGARRWSYVRAVLRSWRGDGVRTPEDLDRRKARRKDRSPGAPLPAYEGEESL